MKTPPSTLDVATAQEGAEAREFEVPALMIAWSRDEPQRAGEVALFERDGSFIFGRGPSASAGRVELVRQRPGTTTRTQPIESPGISREQLRIRARGQKLHVERVGKCAMIADGERKDACVLEPGTTLLLHRQILFLCTKRPIVMRALRDFPLDRARGFGEPDALGLVGESPTAWGLRDEIAFAAKAGAHTLVLGPSGAGKELAARALHALSPRAPGPFVSRNAATLPPGLVDAELFGNVKNYPNPGMAERQGLIGAADGGTLFLDEIGELPASIHANLLRVLDADGDYHRLGEPKQRRSDLRLVAATNRDPSAIKHDLAARFPLTVALPGLDARREDVPLILRHMLARALAKTPDLVGRFVGEGGAVGVSSALVEHLLTRPYTTHVRELEAALWRSMARSRGDFIDIERTKEPISEPQEPDEPVPQRVEAMTQEQIRACVAEHGGNLTTAAKALGMTSRFALYRLLRRRGIDVGALRGDEG